MLGRLPVKVLGARIPNLSLVNDRFWRYDFEKSELEGLGYLCLRGGYSRFVKLPQVDDETGMVAWDARSGRQSSGSSFPFISTGRIIRSQVKTHQPFGTSRLIIPANSGAVFSESGSVN